MAHGICAKGRCSPVKVVVVGLGNQGKKRCAVAGGQLVASVDPINSDADYREISEVPLHTYEAACVCTPEDQKLGIVEYLLGNGKHVLVEKPMLTAERSELFALRALAEESGTVCYTAYNHRFEPHIQRLKKTLDAGDLGPIYRCRFFYGNGTARDVRSSVWRDQGMGVLADLGSHLLDLYLFLLENVDVAIAPWSLNCLENKAFDQVLFGTNATPVLEFEATLLSWLNSFSIDIWGEKGSAHIDGLCKWGPSTYSVRRRVLPSGKPDEEKIIIDHADPTWVSEFEYFSELCRNTVTDSGNDIWINDTLSSLVCDYHKGEHK
jgi:scyllo-inositol 2-dehydrogenase (NADP+)